MSLLSDIMETVYPTISKDFRQQESMCICVEWKSCQLDLYFAKGCFVAKTFLLCVQEAEKLTFHSPQYVTKFKLNSSLRKYFSVFFILSFPSQFMLWNRIWLWNSSKKFSKFNCNFLGNNTQGKKTLFWWKRNVENVNNSYYFLT